jgi:hypothetical protein
MTFEPGKLYEVTKAQLEQGLQKGPHQEGGLEALTGEAAIDALGRPKGTCYFCVKPITEDPLAVVHDGTTYAIDKYCLSATMGTPIPRPNQH